MTIFFSDDGESYNDGDNLTVGGWVEDYTVSAEHEYSNINPYSGSISLRFRNTGSGNVYNYWYHTLTSPSRPLSMTAWFYDNGQTTSYMSGLIRLTASGPDEHTYMGISIYRSATHYVGTIGTDWHWFITNKIRSVGWHKFEIEVYTDSIIYKIDDDIVRTETVYLFSTAPDRIYIRCRKNILSFYFDDILVKQATVSKYGSETLTSQDSHKPPFERKPHSCTTMRVGFRYPSMISSGRRYVSPPSLQDTFIRLNQDANYGHEDYMTVSQSPYYHTRRTYIKFKTSLPTTSLKLYAYCFWVGVSGPIDLYLCSTNWGEYTLTNVDYPEPLSPKIDTITPSEGAWCHFNIPKDDAITYWDGDWLSFIIKADSGTGVGYNFRTRQYLSGEYKAYIEPI